MPAVASFSRYESWLLPAQVGLLCPLVSPALKNTGTAEASWLPLVSQTVAVTVAEEPEMFPRAMPVENVPLAPPEVLSNGRIRVVGEAGRLTSGAVPSPMATFRKPGRGYGPFPRKS